MAAHLAGPDDLLSVSILFCLDLIFVSILFLFDLILASTLFLPRPYSSLPETL